MNQAGADDAMTMRELDEAASRGHATLRQVLMGYECDPVGLYPKLYEAFEKSNGEVVEGKWRNDLHAAAVITSNGELNFWFDPSVLPLYAFPIMERIRTSYEDCRRASRGKISPGNVQEASRIAFDALSIIPVRALISTGGAAYTPNRTMDEMTPSDFAYRLTTVQSALERFEASFQRAALSHVRRWFSIGLGTAWIVVLLIAALIYLAGQAGILDANSATWFATAIAAGSLGSLTSAVYRDLKGDLKLDYLAGPDVKLAAELHVALGGVFGAAAGFLVKGGLLQGFIQPGEKTAAYFYIALAFVAGFVERLLPDSFQRVAERMSGPRQAKR